jgi:D-alanyl-D-alanine carboxypeptidase
MALKRNINYPAASNYKPIIRRDILQDDPIAVWSEATRQSRDINIFEGIESFYGVILGGREVAAEGTILAALHENNTTDPNAVNNMSQFEYQVGIFNGDGTGLTDWMENPLDMTEGSLKQQFFTSLIDYIPMILSTGIDDKKLKKGSIVKVKYTNSNFTDGIIVEIVKAETEDRESLQTPAAAAAVNNSNSVNLGPPDNLKEALAPNKANLCVKRLKQATPSIQNGRLNTDTLMDIGNGHRLQKGAAEAYKRMTQAANNDGIYWSISKSYRTYEEQVRLAQPPPIGVGLYSEGGLAAEPGTSNHGWALAVDLGDGANIYGTLQNNWLIENARNFGFYTIPREPWHWEYRVHEEGEGFEC